ncbi:tigger transposable element-derived protein 4-like [Diorhabda sublineata]|uniref:tigger transposable element-derived protein 4-like n=1 Tax=Diorhabda sublineata TaxID=1163346 RepID=UPI0024E122BE|nr:tigger transposable element-derived protein 4-like [Diorhabda sublineata]
MSEGTQNEDCPMEAEYISRESEEIISRSWVQRFCVRHAIVIKKLSGEAAGVPSATSNDWLSKVWPTIREGYSDSDVFNADETGLFYKLTPDRTLHFKGEKCSNGKLSKERITVLVAANMSGSEKRKLFVIGKSKNPRCFKNVKNLPVDYYNNQKAWMTTDLFNKFLLDWDKELKKKRRKILLLIDNCPSHIDLRDFEFIKVVFLPPNTTSVLQPIDQGIIQKIKTNFRKQLVLRFLQDVEENRETKISILDAIIMVHQAWEDVPATTITNCFKHSGVLGNQNEEQPSEPAETNALDEPEFLPWSESLELPTLINKDVLADYAKIDEGLHTEQDISDEDLINELDADIETDNGEEDVEEQLDIPPLTDALRAAQLLKKFVIDKLIIKRDKNSEVRKYQTRYEWGSKISRKNESDMKVRTSVYSNKFGEKRKVYVEGRTLKTIENPKANKMNGCKKLKAGNNNPSNTIDEDQDMINPNIPTKNKFGVLNNENLDQRGESLSSAPISREKTLYFLPYFYLLWA